MERERARSSLHQRIASALSRAERAHEDSRVLIAEYQITSVAIRETVDDTHRRREARALRNPDK